MSKEISVKEALDVLREAIHRDPDYAWSWHCNIAMSHYDAMLKHGCSEHSQVHTVANEGARRFMRVLFSVDGYEPTPNAPP